MSVVLMNDVQVRDYTLPPPRKLAHLLLRFSSILTLVRPFRFVDRGRGTGAATKVPSGVGEVGYDLVSKEVIWGCQLPWIWLGFSRRWAAGHGVLRVLTCSFGKAQKVAKYRKRGCAQIRAAADYLKEAMQSSDASKRRKSQSQCCMRLRTKLADFAQVRRSNRDMTSSIYLHHLTST